GKNEGGVTLEFEIDGKTIILERTLKRGSKTVNQDYSSVTIDNKKLESSVTEIKTKVLELLDYPPEFIKRTNLLYRYTVYTPQEQMKQIILEDAESRLNILRHIFGIDKYKRIKENLLNLTIKLREESRILQVEIKDLNESKNSLDSSKKFVKIITQKVNSKQKELEEVSSKRALIEREVKDVGEKIKEKETFMKEIEKTNKELRKVINKRFKPRHKHWFQFIEKNIEYDLKTKKPTGKTYAEFVCICGMVKLVKLKESKKYFSVLCC
ncbi:MAG: hypothetical protein IIA88_02695, partial [Bacteroidetes bacterium]|nr:hypothetical protein [Bacteroidota bacterium]